MQRGSGRGHRGGVLGRDDSRAEARHREHSRGSTGDEATKSGAAGQSQLEPGLANGRQAMGFHMQLRLMLRRLRTKTTARLLPAAPRPARASSGQARALIVRIMPWSCVQQDVEW